jgi:hypothetical protein
MSARPGSLDDTLHLILAELRSINAKLGQIATADTVSPAVEHLTAEYNSMLIDPEALNETIEELLHPGRGVIM